MSDVALKPVRGRGQLHVAAALLAAPILSSLLMTIIAVVWAEIASVRSTPPSTVLLMWLFLGAVSLFFSATFGFAWHAIAIRRNWRQWYWYAGPGAALGALLLLLPLFLPMILAGGRTTWSALGWGAALGAVNGAMMAIIFWFMRRPDRDRLKGVAEVFE